MGLKISVCFIWILFSLTFFLLAFHHWRLSKKVLPLFQPPEIPYWEPTEPDVIPVNTGILDKDIKKIFETFGTEFNSYINDYNKSSRAQNQAQTIGYSLAGCTALVSLVLTILPI